MVVILVITSNNDNTSNSDNLKNCACPSLPANGSLALLGPASCIQIYIDTYEHIYIYGACSYIHTW